MERIARIAKVFGISKEEKRGLELAFIQSKESGLFDGCDLMRVIELAPFMVGSLVEAASVSDLKELREYAETGKINFFNLSRAISILDDKISQKESGFWLLGLIKRWIG